MSPDELFEDLLRFSHELVERVESTDRGAIRKAVFLDLSDIPLSTHPAGRLYFSRKVIFQTLLSQFAQFLAEIPLLSKEQDLMELTLDLLGVAVSVVICSIPDNDVGAFLLLQDPNSSEEDYRRALNWFTHPANFPKIKMGTAENTCLQKLKASDWLARQMNMEQDKYDDPEHYVEQFFEHKELHMRRSAVFEAFNQLNKHQRIEFRKPREVFDGEPIRHGMNVAFRFVRQRTLREFKALVVGEVRHEHKEVDRLFRFQPKHQTDLNQLDFDYRKNYPHLGRQSAFNRDCFENGEVKEGYTVYANDLEGTHAPLVEDLQYPKLAWTIPKEVRSEYQLNLLISPKPHHQAAFDKILGFLDRVGMKKQHKALLRAQEIIDSRDSEKFFQAEKGDQARLTYIDTEIEGTHALLAALREDGESAANARKLLERLRRRLSRKVLGVGE